MTARETDTVQSYHKMYQIKKVQYTYTRIDHIYLKTSHTGQSTHLKETTGVKFTFKKQTKKQTHSYKR